jgi:hypothetical protein
MAFPPSSMCLSGPVLTLAAGNCVHREVFRKFHAKKEKMTSGLLLIVENA